MEQERVGLDERPAPTSPSASSAADAVAHDDELGACAPLTSGTLTGCARHPDDARQPGAVGGGRRSATRSRPPTTAATDRPPDGADRARHRRSSVGEHGDRRVRRRRAERLDASSSSRSPSTRSTKGKLADLRRFDLDRRRRVHASYYVHARGQERRRRRPRPAPASRCTARSSDTLVRAAGRRSASTFATCDYEPFAEEVHQRARSAKVCLVIARAGARAPISEVRVAPVDLRADPWTGTISRPDAELDRWQQAT